MKTRLAVVGSGFGLYGLLPAFQQIDSCSVIGLCGKSTDRLVDYCRKTAVPVFQDWREMIDQTKPDAIAVAVVPRHQYEILTFALERGISVFAEKPLCVGVDQAKQLFERSQASKVANMVDFIFREIPEWQKAKDLLDQNSIGQVTQLNVNWSFLSYDIRNQIKSWKTQPDKGGGALSFYCSHALHMLEFFLGKIESLSCRLNYSARNPNEGETVVNLLVKFQSGSTGSIVFNCASLGANEHRWEFQGEKGNLILENSTKSFGNGFALTRYPESGEKEKILVDPIPVQPNIDERVFLVRSLAEPFVRWCQDRTPAKPDFADGLRVQQLIEWARISAREDKIVSTI